MANLEEVYGMDFSSIKKSNCDYYMKKKCTQCNSTLVPITNDDGNGSISFCQKCSKYYNFNIKYCRLCNLPEHNHYTKHQFIW